MLKFLKIKHCEIMNYLQRKTAPLICLSQWIMTGQVGITGQSDLLNSETVHTDTSVTDLRFSQQCLCQVSSPRI
jgi:hypothetical protein